MGFGRAACAPGEIPETVHRVGWRQGAAVGFANLDGAVFVFVYATFVLDDVGPSVGVSRSTDLLLFLTYITLAGIVGGTSCYRRYGRRTRWLERSEPATDERRLGVLRLPRDTALFSLVPWALAALLFTTAGLVFDGDTGHEALSTAVTIVLGGLVTSALSFLLMERAMRPLFALALDGHVIGRHATIGVRARFTLTWALGSFVPLAAIAVIAAHRGPEEDVRTAVVLVAIGGVVAGLVATNTAAKSVADPLDDVRSALSQIEQGNLDVQVPVDDGGEVGRLQAGVNQMVEGLQERHRLADLFGRHVGTEVARRALVEGAGLDSEAREATALFVDVVGSTAMAEVLPPQEVVNTLNAFFGAVVAAVSAEGGWVNKFEGDGALCVFGAPAPQPDHAARALRAARDLRDRIERLAGSHPGLDAAIGVSSGSVVAGNVGTEARYEYTIIGRPVNEAARLSELAKSRPGRALASSGALERAGDEAARWAGLGSVALRGQQAPTSIFEPAETVGSPV